MHRRPNAEGNSDNATGQDGVGSAILWFRALGERLIRVGILIWIEHDDFSLVGLRSRQFERRKETQPVDIRRYSARGDFTRSWREWLYVRRER